MQDELKTPVIPPTRKDVIQIHMGETRLPVSRYWILVIALLGRYSGVQKLAVSKPQEFLQTFEEEQTMLSDDESRYMSRSRFRARSSARRGASPDSDSEPLRGLTGSLQVSADSMPGYSRNKSRTHGDRHLSFELHTSQQIAMDSKQEVLKAFDGAEMEPYVFRSVSFQ
jgi:hypothetical protein